MYRERVEELSHALVPGLFKYALCCNASFTIGANLPRGDLLPVSPSEPHHALLCRLSSLIKAGTTDHELEP